ncbi:MAG: redoxin domain-containing protein [Rhodothermales bacterium]|nr:redoxin domain-containing protein [Rhodothermales bacterium]
MTVRSPEEGVYPLIVSRSGRTLSVDEFVAVDGDSVRISGTYPLGARPLRIVSPENAAWSAYRNTRRQHDARVAELLEAGEGTIVRLSEVTMSTASILWSIPDLYPGTIASTLARAESVVMLEGWDDQLALDRVPSIAPDNRLITDVVRAARRSLARTAGQDSSVQFIRSFVEKVDDPDKKAMLMAELVVAYTDSLQTDLAVETASELRRRFPDSEWASWASRATYELENLMPGMTAPGFTIVTRDGERVSSSDINQGFILLEFYEPLDQVFLRELARRNAVIEALDGSILRAVSMSVDPDSAVNEALFDGRDLPGMFSYLPDGRQSAVAQAYNVHVLPTRYLIDPDGRIVSKYRGPAMNAIEQDLAAVINSLEDLQTLPGRRTPANRP